MAEDGSEVFYLWGGGMQSSILPCLSQAGINWEVATGRASGIKMGD